MADRDVDVSLNVQVQGEKDVNSLSASLNKLGAAAKGSTKTTGASLNKMADAVKGATAKAPDREKATAKEAVRQLYAYHKGEQIGTAIKTVISKVAGAFTKSATGAAGLFARKQQAQTRKKVDKGADQLDSIQKSVKSLSIAGTIASSIYILTSALKALGFIGRLITAPFRALYSVLETTFNYAKNVAENNLKYAAQAERSQMTLDQVQTDSIAGTLLLGKAYDSLNENAQETFKKMNLSTKQYTAKTGQKATILDLVQYLSERYGKMRDSLDAAKTEKEKKRIRARMERFRDKLTEIPSEIANVVLSWTPVFTGSLIRAVNRIQGEFEKVRPQRSQKQRLEASMQMTGEIGLIQTIFSGIKDTIGQFSMGPINATLIMFRKKMEKLGPALGELGGALSEKTWLVIANILTKISVKEWVDKIKKWAEDVKASDPGKLGEGIGASLDKLSQAFLKLLDKLAQFAPMVARAVTAVDKVLKAFGVKTPEEVEAEEKAERLAGMRKRAEERTRKAHEDEARRAAEARKLGHETLAEGTKEFPPAAQMYEILQRGADAIKTSGADTGKKVEGGFKNGSDEAKAAIIAGFAAGATQAGGTLQSMISNAHVNVTVTPRGGDVPTP